VGRGNPWSPTGRGNFMWFCLGSNPGERRKGGCGYNGVSAMRPFAQITWDTCSKHVWTTRDEPRVFNVAYNIDVKNVQIKIKNVEKRKT